MQQAIDQFTAKAAHRGLGAINFVYYSGRAANNEQRDNFLIPVDAPDPSAPSFWYDLVSLSELISQLSRQAPDAKTFVVIEACGNPLKPNGAGGPQQIKLRGLQQSREIPDNMLVAHAPAWCELASGPGGEASLYAQALAEEIVKPDTDAAVIFQNAQAGLFWLQHKAMAGVYFKTRRAPAPPNLNLADLPVSFGDTYDEIKAAYPSAPEPDHANPQGHRIVSVHMKELGIWFFFDERERINLVRLDEPWKGSVLGVTMGSSKDAVRLKMGEPARKGIGDDSYYYDKGSLYVHFDFDGQNRLSTIFYGLPRR